MERQPASIRLQKGHSTRRTEISARYDRIIKRNLSHIKYMTEHVASEAPEVQEAFRRELSDTIREVFDHEYRYQTESLSLEDVDLRQEIQIHQRESELVVAR